nr:hypothetical protein [uncultured Tyzzerella sp.]
MDIRPVDVQMFINKSSQLNRAEDFDQKNMDQNLMFSEHLKKNIETENRKTIETNKSEEQNINKDGKGNNGHYKKQQKNKNINSKEEKSKKTNSLSFLDISI